jgi:hypothetical protein
VWEASASIETTAPAKAVWALWEDPSRWPDWNHDIASVSADEPLAAGVRVRVRLKRSIPMRFTVTQLEPEHLFTDETRMPGARMGHEHRLEPVPAGGVRIHNRLYLDGPLERLYAAALGGRMRASVRQFVGSEKALAETRP